MPLLTTALTSPTLLLVIMLSVPFYPLLVLMTVLYWYDCRGHVAQYIT